jgi:hypothetical protein
MKIDVKRIFPNNPSVFSGYLAVRILLAIYMFVIVVRSCIPSSPQMEVQIASQGLI